MQKVTLVIVGIGGFGEIHLQELLHGVCAEGFELIGAVDTNPERSRFYAELCERKIPVYPSLENFYENHSAQMALLVTPTNLHAKQAIYCMEHGSDVLCEKPLCVLPEDAKEMMAARDRTGRKLAIGFQWSFSRGILKLKQDIHNGFYGKIKRIRTIVLFPRNQNYYERSIWPGKRRLSTGELVLDSVASNATAHYLHNMLFLMGEQIDRSEEPVRMQAEVYRANPIEMFDTCALRLWTRGETELLFLASHAVPMADNRPPEFIIEGELGTVTFRYENGQEILEGVRKDGQTIRYEDPSRDGFRKINSMREAILENQPLSCIPETALPHVKCIYELAKCFPETPVFRQEDIQYLDETNQYVCVGLTELLDRCWKNGTLPWEEGAGWAFEPREIVFGGIWNERKG